MTRKITALFVIYLILSSLISVQIFADAPEAAEPFPENDLAKQEEWVLKNPNSFNPENEKHKAAFKSAYDKGIVKYPNHIEAINKYVSTFKDQIPERDRKIASDYVSYLVTRNDPKQSRFADLSAGNVKIINPGSSVAIVDGYGVPHYIDEIVTMQKVKSIARILSDKDGKLHFVTGTGEIVTEGTSLKLNQNQEFQTNNGQIFDMKSHNGKVSVGYGKGLLKISCDSCTIDIGYTSTTLNKNGYINYLEGNRFLVENGITEQGNHQALGSYEFGLKSEIVDGRKILTGIDETQPIKLLKFKTDGLTYGSRIHYNDPAQPDNKPHYGDVKVRTGMEGNVVVCLACKQIPSQEGYAGSVVFAKDAGNCNALGCTDSYKASIKGIVAACFEKDACFEGANNNIHVSYSSARGNTREIGKFYLEGCNGCKVDKDAVAGSFRLNNGLLSVYNQQYSRTNPEPQLRVNEIKGTAAVLSYINFAQFNEYGINFADKDIYKSGDYTLDTYNTGLYKSNTLKEETSGGKSVVKYLNEFYMSDYIKDPVGTTGKINDILKSLNNQEYQRDLYLIDKTAYNYASDGKKVSFNALIAAAPIESGKSSLIVGKTAVAESKLLGLFFLEEVNKEIYDNLKKRDGWDSLSDKEKEDEFNRAKLQKALAISVQEQRQKVAGIVDLALEKEQGSIIAEKLANFLKIYPKEKAEELLTEYDKRAKGAEKVANILIKDKSMTLEQVYNLKDNDIKSAFKEPQLLLQLNYETIAQQNPEQKYVSIYYVKDGNIQARGVELSSARREATFDALRSYTSDAGNFPDHKLGIAIVGQQFINELSSPSDKILMENFVKGVLYDRKIDGKFPEGEIISLAELNNYRRVGLRPENHLELGNNRYLIASPEIITLLKSERVDKTPILLIAQANTDYITSETTKAYKEFVYAIIPKTPIEAVFNIATSNLQTLKAGAAAVWAANGVGTAVKASLALGVNGVLATSLGLTVGEARNLAARAIKGAQEYIVDGKKFLYYKGKWVSDSGHQILHLDPEFLKLESVRLRVPEQVVIASSSDALSTVRTKQALSKSIIINEDFGDLDTVENLLNPQVGNKKIPSSKDLDYYANAPPIALGEGPYFDYFKVKVDQKTTKFIDSFKQPFETASQELKEMFSNAEVKGRIKDHYKLEEKIYRDLQSGDIVSRDEVFNAQTPLEAKIRDVIGMRVTLRDINEIGEASKKIQSKIDSGEWGVLAHKDFITQPKEEGYRAVHYIVVIDNKPVEIQLRTHEQDIWAKWSHDQIYKGKFKDDSTAIQYSRQTSDWVYDYNRGVKRPLPECPQILVKENICFSCC